VFHCVMSCLPCDSKISKSSKLPFNSISSLSPRFTQAQKPKLFLFNYSTTNIIIVTIISTFTTFFTHVVSTIMWNECPYVSKSWLYHFFSIFYNNNTMCYQIQNTISSLFLIFLLLQWDILLNTLLVPLHISYHVSLLSLSSLSQHFFSIRFSLSFFFSHPIIFSHQPISQCRFNCQTMKH